MIIADKRIVFFGCRCFHKKRINSIFGKNPDIFDDYLDEKDRWRSFGANPTFTFEQFKERLETIKHVNSNNTKLSDQSSRKVAQV